MTLTHRLIAPGWYRAVLGVVLGFAFGLGLVVLVRPCHGWEPLWDWNAIVTVGGLIAAPLGFLVGIGCFDYWFRCVGRPHRPRGPLGSRRLLVEGLLPRQHRSQGHRHPIHLHHDVLLRRGRADGHAHARRAGPAGHPVRGPNTFNGLFSVHASLMIFLFIIPVFAGIANFVIPLMIGAPDMAFPRLNALSYWMLPVAA